MSLWVVDTDPVELQPNYTEDDLQIVIKAVYKQILGNAYLMESERNQTAESLLRNRDITVRGFVRAIAKSDLYRSLFFESVSQYRFIELNCKHFLGRPPIEQAEISYHVGIYNESGYEAEIDSYLDSQEYLANFGENIVPYSRSSSTTVGIKNVGFNRTFALDRGFASSDVSSNAAILIQDLGANLPTKIKAPTSGGGTPSNRSKRFRITVRKGSSTPLYKRSNMTYEVNYQQMTQKIQSIQRMGGTIVSITEVT
ncbi:MAG: phycobilisome rod-core linker polypeptide [Prochloraceae cyanobacterium]|nr:phycobilisome rod-core linker polypeptide [Prochloraceae cyanobacterium]